MIIKRSNPGFALWRQIAVIVFLLAVGQNVWAVEPPSAGSQFQQLPPPPVIQKAVPEIQVERGIAPVAPVADQAKILVNSLHIIGQTLYSEAELVAITGFIPGSLLSLSELRGMASKIADHYHRKGYFVAQAYLPAQEIKDGVVTITVIEGRYGKITLNTPKELSDYTAKSIFSGLNSGDTITIAPLERRLLLLSDLPGMDVKSTLVPGASVGAADLIVDITPGDLITGEVDVDNAGNRYTGEYRIGTTINFNEPFGYGDVAAIRAVTSGFGLFYVRAAYEAQIGKARAGAAYSFLEYRLMKEFEALHANGTAHIASIYGSYPLIRSRKNNIYAKLSFDYKTFQDRVDLTSTVTDKQAQVLMPGLYGDSRDGLFGGGVNTYSFTWFIGNLDIQTAAAHSLDAATAQADGIYNKLGFRVTRLQSVIEPLSLYASLHGQLAFQNLDVSEKMELGGMYAIRAYPEGEAYADQGYVLTMEARWRLSTLLFERLPGQMQLIGFVDTGRVTVNKNPWTNEPNTRTLSGAGVGLHWMDYNNFSVKAYYAFKLGNEAATSAPDESGRFWIQLVKYF